MLTRVSCCSKEIKPIVEPLLIGFSLEKKVLDQNSFTKEERKKNPAQLQELNEKTFGFFFLALKARVS